MNCPLQHRRLWWKGLRSLLLSGSSSLPGNLISTHRCCFICFPMNAGDFWHAWRHHCWCVAGRHALLQQQVQAVAWNLWCRYELWSCQQLSMVRMAVHICSPLYCKTPGLPITGPVCLLPELQMRLAWQGNWTAELYTLSLKQHAWCWTHCLLMLAR